jgi:hypothetical protein
MIKQFTLICMSYSGIHLCFFHLFVCLQLNLFVYSLCLLCVCSYMLCFLKCNSGSTFRSSSKRFWKRNNSIEMEMKKKTMGKEGNKEKGIFC